MSRLLYSGFVRAWKDPLVRMGMVSMFLLSVFLVVLTYYTGVKEDEEMYLYEIMYLYLGIIALISAVFSSYLSGQEYYDGAIRNKLIAGHSRVSIYLSNLVVNVVVVLSLWLLSFVTECVLGLLLLDGLGGNVDKVFSIFFGSILTIVALCAIFTLIAMSGQNHKTSDTICLLTVCLMLFVSLYMMYMMSELDAYDRDIKEGIEVIITKEDALYPVLKNREAYEFCYDFLPSGQIIQYISKDVRRPEQLLLCSAGIIVVTTFLGAFLFCRKNIQ